MTGSGDHLTSWKSAQIFYGLAAYAAKVGYYHASYLVVEEKVGYIAKVDIV